MLRSNNLISSKDVKSPIAEAFKTLRTNIQFSFTDSGNPLKTILITSTSPSEGKSTTAANLAITMAQSDLKVLLIDCDLRKPVVHRAFTLLNGKGLTNMLVEGTNYRDLVNLTAIKNLEVITSGLKPPNPSELLGSNKMMLLMEKLKEDYDMIVLDSPPALPVTDSTVLSRLVDGIVLVVEYGGTTFELLEQTKSAFEKVNAKILGVVLNKIPQSERGYHYYYYHDESESGKHNGKKPKKTKAKV